MRIRRFTRFTPADGVALEFTLSEAKIFYEELADLPGGSRLPKLKEVCGKLAVMFDLADGVFNQPDGSIKSVRKSSKKKS